MLELYTRDGVGSMIATAQFECLRTATIEDISGILELIRPLEQQGTLIKRSREQLELEIHNFHIITRDHEVIACVALYDTDTPTIAELACLAVNPQYRVAIVVINFYDMLRNWQKLKAKSSYWF
ncbi:GNAT family N-acetyltransferase [Candidatus Thiothrix anitrata]|uniref:hypothetical protein n=1 Tax=Candidatus Thiothrix anitrata TaxID=2823902 RepID=UPI001D183810|nr:hypothetical protein [Candidatus Thiothrix anitrata]